MKRIEVKVLNPGAFQSAEQMAVTAARLTQAGQKIQSMADFLTLYERPYNEAFVSSLVSLPHPTLQKLGVINVVVVGASRRFLAQITRHQNEVKFMSASLQYSDYQNSFDFAVPYEIIDTPAEEFYLSSCRTAMLHYRSLMGYGAGNDSAGYAAPQGLRNVLIISATPFQWKHMIGQRICRRNTTETRIVMLKIWAELEKYSPALFYNAGAFCMGGPCKEGKMSCGRPMTGGPLDILKEDFPKLFGQEKEDEA